MEPVEDEAEFELPKVKQRQVAKAKIVNDHFAAFLPKLASTVINSALSFLTLFFFCHSRLQ